MSDTFWRKIYSASK